MSEKLTFRQEVIRLLKTSRDVEESLFKTKANTYFGCWKSDNKERSDEAGREAELHLARYNAYDFILKSVEKMYVE